MKVLLINPPIGYAGSIYGAIPILLGQLKANNIDAEILDMNIEFLKGVLSPKHLQNTINLLEQIYKNNKILNENINIKYQLTDEQLNELNKKIEKFFSKRKVIDLLIKSNKNFYDTYKDIILKSGLSEETASINETLFQLYSLVFLPYYPEKVYMRLDGNSSIVVTNNPLYKQVYEDIVDKCSNRRRNIYIDFYEKKIEELNLDKYDIIGITIPFEQNTYPALTLGKIIKVKTKAKVVIGGVLPTTVKDGFVNHPDMFGTFFDNILVGEGEKSIIDYVRYIENKIPVTNVSGLLYKENNIIKQNEILPINNINEIHPPCYDGVKFDNYFINKYIELEFSKGCYWKKCTFCYEHLWKKYHIRNPIDAVNIIEKLKNKYNTNNFSILDDALSINFVEKFADEIIKRNLNITYNCFLRMEKALTYDILKKIKNSGIDTIFFGIESASERILDLMQKGIKLENVERILKYCYELGIHVDTGFMYGFPTETEEDVMKTINFIKKNKKYMAYPNNFIFHITKSSAMLTKENKEKMHITNVKQPEEFSDDIVYDAPGISKERIYELLDKNGLIYANLTKWL